LGFGIPDLETEIPNLAFGILVPVFEICDVVLGSGICEMASGSEVWVLGSGT
jgi:hypothetical protein